MRFIKFLVKSDKELKSEDMYVVSWWRRTGSYSMDEEKCYRAFFTQEDAQVFANSIEEAHKLIGDTHNIKAKIEKIASNLQ